MISLMIQRIRNFFGLQNREAGRVHPGAMCNQSISMLAYSANGDCYWPCHFTKIEFSDNRYCSKCGKPDDHHGRP